ncbi:acetyl xylan esterase, AXE1 family [Brachyspira intermedia PWS/A]|uniref:Acetyl xylan esterase, AXE1 family n=1 Tax=Brachyspira intermedia (strain ATCC 51140 / PWS/A) TaxID=1045858 RepID=G0EPE3_BRAIP|nr:acetylxylan esterase [Brachyspira intermedia]AEM23213.1 acetyl xylan esterase, AXE1 family [Brachyspira intermedia PWS/A]
MAFFDLSLEELYKYKGSGEEPKDFDEFWLNTLNENNHKTESEYTLIDTYLKLFDVWNVSFKGYSKHVINGWYIAPKYARENNEKLTCIMHYPGYGGGRDYPNSHLLFPSAGYSIFVMEVRGQGAEGGNGATTPDPVGSTPHADGFLTMGILDKKDYFYKRVFVDAFKSIEAAKEHPLTGKIAINGTSQGGGIALALLGLSALKNEKIEAAMIDVPFLCDYKRACTITDTLPYNEIARFCKTNRMYENRAFETLSYFDGAFFAKRSKVKALFSVGLMDILCPPSTVFAAYNNYAGEKSINVYTFNGHEGGDNEQSERKLEFLNYLNL